MRSYSETDAFSRWELEQLSEASSMVGRIRHAPRCHELAHAVAGVLGLQPQDGHFGLVEHSWIWLTPASRPWAPGTYPPNILDVYSVGSLPQVQLVYMRGMLPYAQAYRPGPARTDIDPSWTERIKLESMA